MKLVAGWNDGKTGPTCPVCYPCCGAVFYTPMGLGTETDAIVVSTVSQERADWKADQIAFRVNNHERLVEALEEVRAFLYLYDRDNVRAEKVISAVDGALQAGKGGE